MDGRSDLTKAGRPEDSSVDFAQQQRNPTKHLVGIGIVILMHLLLAWALVSGLAHKIVEVVKAPIETKIIEEVKPPPPPPENLPPPPKFAPPPPSYVPPPEVVVNPPPVQQPTITTTPVEPPPAPVTIAPPAPEAPPVVAAAPRTAPVIDFKGCAKPEYTAAARRAEAQGTTLISFLIDVDGKVLESRVERSAGGSRDHKALDRAALEALSKCQFKPGTLEGKPERSTSRVEYVWKLVD
jgi:periplasmic protein TonB